MIPARENAIIVNTMMGRTARRLVGMGMAVGLGCGSGSSSSDDTDGDTETTGTSVATSTAGTSTGSTASASSGTAESGNVDTGFDPPQAECGNGFVEPGEQCDDANDIEDDECNNACLVPCGLEWAVTELPPTGESNITGLQVARDGDDQIVTAGYLREVTTDQEGTPMYGPDEVLVVKVDASGAEAWDLRLTSDVDDLTLGGLAVDAAGDVYLAMTTDAADGGTDIEVRKLAGSDGSEVWTHAYDSQVDDSEDAATGLALTSDGDVVIAGTVRVAEMDSDVWVRRLSSADGAEVWTSTWSGQGGGGFSTDKGGSVAVASDGAVYVMAREYVDFETAPAVLLRFASDGSASEVVFTPQHDGQIQVFTPLDVEVDRDDNVLLAVERLTFGFIEFWVYKLDAGGAELWRRERADYEDAGDNWRLLDLAVDAEDSVVLAGRFWQQDPVQDFAWGEIWLRRLDPGGALMCAIDYRAPSEELVPASLSVEGVATRSDGGPIVTGMQELETEVALWLATFRPQ